MQPSRGRFLLILGIWATGGGYDRNVPITPPHLQCAAAVDRHADTRTAAWSVGEQLLEGLGGTPSLVMTVASYHHAAALPEAMATIRDHLDGPSVVGVTSAGVLANGEEHHAGATLAALAISGPGVRARSFAFDPTDGPPEAWSRPLIRSRLRPASPPRAIAVFADPFSSGSAALPEVFAGAAPPGTPLVGGLLTGGSQPGTNVMVTEDRVLNGGVVGFVLEGAIDATQVVAHSGRSVGPPMVVTDVSGGTVRGLSGRPAAERLDEVVAQLPPADRERLAGRPLIGIAADAMQPVHGRGDFLLRPVATVDRVGGGLLVPGGVPRGATIRFQVVDGDTEREDLAMALDLANLDERPVRGLLAASSIGRGPTLLGESGHDAARIQARLGEIPALGFVTAAEIAPIRNRPYLAGLGLSALALRSPHA